MLIALDFKLGIYGGDAPCWDLNGLLDVSLKYYFVWWSEYYLELTIASAIDTSLNLYAYFSLSSSPL